MLKKKKFIILLIFLLMVISSSAAAQDVSRSPRINFNGITGDDFIGQAVLLYPFRNTEDSLWFTDFRYRMSSDDIDEWNLGLGYRKKLENYENKVLGGYIFKDRRNEYEHDWDMWTVGGELLTDQWDFRLNGYITDDETIVAPENDEIIVKSQKLYYKEGFLSSMNGLDFEVGKRFVDRDDWLKNVGVYLKLFSFFEDNVDTMYGHQLRIDKQFGDLNKTTWKLGAKWRDDDTRGSKTEATFAVSIPFGKGKIENKREVDSKEEIIEARMTEQPERDLDIVVAESDDPDLQEAKNLDGSSLGDVIFVSAEGTGDGSSKSNPTNIFALHTMVEGETYFADENDVIILLGDDGAIDIGNYSDSFQSLQLLDGQKILSPGGRIMLRSADNPENIAYFRPDGKRATLTNSTPLESDRINVINTANNITISGIKFEGADYFIRGTHLSPKNNININNNIFSDMRDRSIYLNDHTNINISNNKFMDGTGEIELIYNKEGDFNVNVSNNTFGDMPDEAMYISANSSTNNNIDITNNYIKSGTHNLIEVRSAAEDESNINITGNTIENSTVWGIYVNTLTYDGIKSGIFNLDITDNHLGNVKNKGIYVNYYASYNSSSYSPFDSSVINISDNSIDNMLTYTLTNSAIYLKGHLIDSSVYIENNTIVHSDAYGIHLDIAPDLSGTYNDYYINNNLIGEVTGLGIYVKGDQENNKIINKTEIRDNTIKKVNPFGSLADAIYVDNKYLVNQTDIIGNKIFNSDGRGIYVKGGAINDSFIIIAENDIENAADNGIEVEFTKPLTANPYKVAIADNTIGYSGQNGIYIAPDYLSFSDPNRAQIIIDGNKITESYLNSIEVNSQYNSNYLLDISKNMIGSTTQSGIYILSDVNNSHRETTYYPSEINVNLENNNIVSADNAGIEMVVKNYEGLSGYIDYNLINNIFGQTVDPYVIYPDITAPKAY